MKELSLPRLRLAMSAVLFMLNISTHAGNAHSAERVPRLEMELADGTTLSSRCLDGKVVIHYFWGTWCPICRADLPQMQRLYTMYRSRGLEIIGHSLDDDRSAVLEFWQEQAYTFPVAMRSGEVRAAFGPIKGTPTVFLVDRGGVLRFKYLGTFPHSALQERIEALLTQEGNNGRVRGNNGE